MEVQHHLYQILNTTMSYIQFVSFFVSFLRICFYSSILVLGDPPKFTNASFWRDNETTWNLHFSPPTLMEGFTSTKSVLRLLKIIPVSEIAHATKTGDCSKDDEPLIRITISAYTKKNKKGI